MIIDAEFIVRTLAVVAAIAVVAGPTVVAAVQKALSWEDEPEAAGVDDAHTLLEIARRLQRAGSTEGVKLCQQLIDVMLKPEGGKK